MGKDAIVSVLAKFVHPSEHIRRVHPNATATLRIENLRVVRLDRKKVRRKDQAVVVFVSDAYAVESGDVPELYAIPRYCNIVTEGPREDFFVQADPEENPGPTDEETPTEIPAEAVHSSRRSVTDDDVAQLRGAVEIDDDNEPVPENVPDNSTAPTTSILAPQFGHSEGLRAVRTRKLELTFRMFAQRVSSSLNCFSPRSTSRLYCWWKLTRK